MTAMAASRSLPTLLEVRTLLAAILPQTGLLPPAGPFRVLDRLSPIHGDPDAPRALDGDDEARAYLARQIARSDWERWREVGGAATGPFAAAPWRWTLGGALDRSQVLDAYPTTDDAHVLMVEVPLIALDRTDVILRAQAHAPGMVDDHEWRYGRREETSWIRMM